MLGIKNKVSIKLGFISLLLSVLFSGCFDEGGPTQPRTDHMIVFGIKLVAANDTLFDYFLLESQDTVELSVNQTIADISPYFIEPDTSVYPKENISVDHFLKFENESTFFEVEQEEFEKWDFNLRGLSAGSANLILRLMHIDHSDFTVAIPIKVNP